VIRARHVAAGFVAFVVGLSSWGAGAQDLGTVRVGVLEFGTVNWELDVIKHHGLDTERGFTLEVQGFASHHTWRFAGCEDNGFLLLRNARGNVATLHASWTEWRGYGYRLELYGTEGFLRFGYPPLHLVHGRRRDGKLRTRRYLFPLYQVLERLRGWEWGLVETLERDLAAWITALGRGEPPPIDGHDGLEAVRLAHSARRPPDEAVDGTR